MNNNEIVLRMIPVKEMLDAFTKIWNSGADYVDITGIKGVPKDTLKISINKDYFSKDIRDESNNSEQDIDFNELI